MTQQGYREVSDEEVASGVAFAKKGKKGERGYPPTNLDPDHFRGLCNRTRAVMEGGIPLYDAKTSVLNGAFRQRTKKEQEHRRATSSAISHVFGKRSGYKRKKAKAPQESSIRFPADARGQYEFAV
jgi:hypothetical protein